MKIVNTQVPVRHLLVILRHRTPKVSSAGLGVDQPKYLLIPIYFAVLFGPDYSGDFYSFLWRKSMNKESE